MKWIDEEMIEEISEGIAEFVMKYIERKPGATTKVIADIIQSGIEGWVAGTEDRLNRAEMEMEDD